MIGVAWMIWRLRWLVGATILIAVIGGGWLHLKALRAEATLAQAQAGELRRANRENLEAMAALRGERDFADRILAQRAAQVRDRAEDLTRLMKKALDHDPSQDCPLSPAIDAVLDGLSGAAGDGDAD